jgi:hypothetical protein
MTDAPETIWVTASVAIKHWMDIPSMNRAPRIVYTRADVAQARIAQLEAALQYIARHAGQTGFKQTATHETEMLICDYARAALGDGA